MSCFLIGLYKRINCVRSDASSLQFCTNNTRKVDFQQILVTCYTRIMFIFISGRNGMNFSLETVLTKFVDSYVEVDNHLLSY